MMRNYLETALRGAMAHRLFSCINLFGLAAGLASVILIGLYVSDELSYDRYHTDSDRLYRVSQDFYPVNGSAELRLAANAPPAAELLKADFPEIVQNARLFGGRVLLTNEDVAFYEDAVRFVDPAFTQMFHFDWIAGDPATALSQPFDIVLTESVARRYFGDEDPLGKTLKLENALDLNVAGVIHDLPGNTHLSVNVLASVELVLRRFGERARTSWNENISFHTYIKLAPGVAIETLEQRFPEFIDRHVGENASQWTGLSTLAVPDIHLHSVQQAEMKEAGSMATVITLLTVAGAILLIACFNFMNLATALSALRGKEVGVRRSIGAERRQLVWQFLGEALGMALLATVVAVAIVELVLPAFNAVTGKTLSFNLLSDGRLQLALLALVMVTGFGAGAWPAFYLSAINPVQALRSRSGGMPGGVLFRNVLVTLQFSITIVLVITTAVVLLQARYARERDSGFNSEQVVILNGSPTQGVTQRWETLKDELLAHPDIVEATASNLVPGNENPNSFSVRRAGTRQDLDTPLPFMFVDYGFFETYDVRLLGGRTFKEEFATDRVALPTPDAAPTEEGTGNFILNASAARNFGWTPDEAVGQPFDVTRNGRTLRGTIVGVVDDVYFESVYFNVKPMMFVLAPAGTWLDGYSTLNSAALKITGTDTAATLAFIDRTWQQVIPEFPVTRSFLSDGLDALYREEQQLGQLYSYSSLLAILIACLGLFGLATFNAQRRIKEIGVRKVMGGSVWSIVLLLTNDFSKLVLVSNLIAWPIAYVAMERWLENFAYRIDLTPLVFIGSGLIALCIAWVTVGGTAAKAANQKPVLALRYE